MTLVEYTFGWDLCKWRRLIPYVVNAKVSNFIVIAGFGFNLVFIKEGKQ